MHLLSIYINCTVPTAVNLALVCSSFPGCRARASYHSLPGAVIGLRNLHVLIPGPQPSSWWECQGHCSPQGYSSEGKGGNTPFSVNKMAVLTLTGYLLEWSRTTKLPLHRHSHHILWSAAGLSFWSPPPPAASQRASGGHWVPSQALGLAVESSKNRVGAAPLC